MLWQICHSPLSSTADTLTGIYVSPTSSRWTPCEFVLTALGVMDVACLLHTPGFHLQLSRRSPTETPRCGEFECSHVSLVKLKGGPNITLGGGGGGGGGGQNNEYSGAIFYHGRSGLFLET